MGMVGKKRLNSVANSSGIQVNGDSVRGINPVERFTQGVRANIAHLLSFNATYLGEGGEVACLPVVAILVSMPLFLPPSLSRRV
jgi:hypothetical protein